jgi:hypothetical protein
MLDFIKDIGIAQWLKQANKKRREYPKMLVELRRELDEYYAPTIQRVEQILGRRLEVWRDRSMKDLPDAPLDLQIECDAAVVQKSTITHED